MSGDIKSLYKVNVTPLCDIRRPFVLIIFFSVGRIVMLSLRVYPVGSLVLEENIHINS